MAVNSQPPSRSCERKRPPLNPRSADVYSKKEKALNLNMQYAPIMKPVHNNLMPESASGSESETASTRVSSKSQKKRNVPI
jgi:hypothetical protein